MRSLPDRIRQVVLFEAAGLLLIAPPFAWLSGQASEASFGVLFLLSLIALAWNAVYGFAFDRMEARRAGRRADQRPKVWRIVHAVGFEFGLLLWTLPILMLTFDWGFWQALSADVGLALAYAVFAFFFHLLYDYVFPIAPADETA
ncbi:MAG: PACE efflux transporter [Zoogloeaceae bacterium]|nr:PACE efflux transporter [Zoogloeaceae bacterium]